MTMEVVKAVHAGWLLEFAHCQIQLLVVQDRNHLADCILRPNAVRNQIFDNYALRIHQSTENYHRLGVWLLAGGAIS